MPAPGILNDCYHALIACPWQEIIVSCHSQPCSHRFGHFIPLRQQLLSIVLRHNGLQHLVTNRRQDTLVPVQAQALHANVS